MKKQKYKKYKQIDNLYVINNNLTKEEIIEIQSKSYYLALKQIEEEKQIEDKKNTSPTIIKYNTAKKLKDSIY